MKLILLIFFILPISLAFSQSLQWESIIGIENYSYSGFSIKQLPNGDIFAFGKSSDGNNNADWLLIKLDSMGKQKWTKYYGKTQTNESGLFINTTKDNALIAVGTTTNANNTNVLISKLDTSGTIIWQTNIGEANLNESAKYIEPTADNAYIACGFITQPDLNANDFLVLKIDSIGNLIWQKSYGFLDNDYAQVVKNTTDGNFIVTGDSKQNGLDYENYAIKINADGEKIWDVLIGDENSNGNQNVFVNSNGSFTLVGESTTFDSFNFDIFVAQISSNGNSQWFKYIGGLGTDAGFSVIKNNVNDYLIAGYSNSYNATLPINPMVCKLNSEANSVGVNYYNQPGIAIAYEIISTYNSKGYLIGGKSNSNMYVAKVMDTDYLNPFNTVLNALNVVNNKQNIAVFPNPCGNYFSLNNVPATAKNLEVRLYNILGNLVQVVKQVSSSNTVINVNKQLANGIYAVEIQGLSANPIYTKLIINK